MTRTTQAGMIAFGFGGLVIGLVVMLLGFQSFELASTRSGREDAQGAMWFGILVGIAGLFSFCTALFYRLR